MQKVRKVCPASKVVTLFKAPTGVLIAILTNYIFKRQLFRQLRDNFETTLVLLWDTSKTPFWHGFWTTLKHPWASLRQLKTTFGQIWESLRQFGTTLR